MLVNGSFMQKFWHKMWTITVFLEAIASLQVTFSITQSIRFLLTHPIQSWQSITEAVQSVSLGRCEILALAVLVVGLCTISYIWSSGVFSLAVLPFSFRNFFCSALKASTIGRIEIFLLIKQQFSLLLTLVQQLLCNRKAMAFNPWQTLFGRQVEN